jgi:hypothetical protein
MEVTGKSDTPPRPLLQRDPCSQEVPRDMNARTGKQPGMEGGGEVELCSRCGDWDVIFTLQIYANRKLTEGKGIQCELLNYPDQLLISAVSLRMSRSQKTLNLLTQSMLNPS